MSTIIVSTTADAGNGSLRGAIATAKSGDTIKFSNKLARKTIVLKSGQLTLDKNLTIDGGDAAGLVISGNNNSRVFYLDKKRKATLKNLTIADGKTKGAGGGIDTRHESEITLQNVKVHGNTSELGGGMRVGHLAKATILNSSFKDNSGKLTSKYKGFSAGAISHNESRGQLIIKGTTFANNKGYNGGAIYSFSGISLVIEDSTFQNNVGDKGGSIFTDGVSSKGYNSGLSNDGKLIIRRSEFVGNKAKGGGGAIYAWGYTRKQGYKDDQAIIEDSKFVDNAVTLDKQGKASGGAIWAKMGLDIRNVTFADNVADQQGGALWTESKLPINIVNSTFSENRAVKDAGGAMFLNNRSTPVNITNSTIAYNQAGRANGALWFDGSHNVTLKNSIVAFNTAIDRRQDQVGYQAKDGGGNLEFATSSQALRVTNNSLVADPLLGSLTLINGDLVHPLKPGSPAVNAGVTSGAPTTDQRGIQRDSKVDIGAFELVASAPSPLKAQSLTASPSFSATTPKQSVATLMASPITTPVVNLMADPVAYLSLNDGKGRLAKDSSTRGRNNAGALVADADWTEGVKGGAIALDGKGDAIKLKNSGDINLGTHSKRTISLRFQADDIGSNKRQVLYEEGAGIRGLNIYLDQDRLYVGGWNTPGKESGWSGTWLSTKLGKEKALADKCHKVDLVLDGGSEVTQNALRGYLDGQQFGSGAGSQLWSHSGGIGIGSINGGTRFHDGITPGSGSGFAGAVDEVMVFNDALSSSELKTFL